MKKFLILSLLIAGAVATAAGATVAPYGGARIFWDMSTESTVFPSGGYARVRTLADGRLMAVAQRGGISICFSEDGGRNWSSPVVIAQNPLKITEAVPDMIQLSDGTIVVGYNPRPSSPYSSDRKFGIRCRRSTDNGATWSDEIFIHDASHLFNDGCWEPAFLQLPTGELQCYFADEGPYAASAEQQISMCRSMDGGQTWSEAECVSFRPDNRDGMPVPLLLSDPDEIVVIVEDSGWYKNYGMFTPTTVRCPLSVNWHDYHVGGADDPNRASIFDFTTNANMGAPYICAMADGTTVASCQSTYKRTGDKRDMYVMCGDSRARHFKAISRPFGLSESSEALWNSLSPVDDGTAVLAVAGIDGEIKCMKGYPRRYAEIAYSETVTVDGKLTPGEKYTNARRNLLPMGTVCRNRTMIDFAYDNDNLYFTARVIDADIINTNATDNDMVTLYVDPSNLSTDVAAEGLHRYDMDAAGNLRYRYVSGTTWRLLRDYQGISVKCNASARYYDIEAAMPWTELGLQGVPDAGAVVRVAIEIKDKDAESTVTETLPDVDNSKSSTWFELRLGPRTSGMDKIANDEPRNMWGRTTVSPTGCVTVGNCDEIKQMSAYTVSGALCAQGSGELQLPAKGAYIVQLLTRDNSTHSVKIIYK